MEKTIYYHGGGCNKTYLAHLGQYLMGAKLFSGTIYMRNNMIITVKLNTFESCMVSMATNYAILKKGGLPTKSSYLSSYSSWNTIFGTKLILIHSTLI